ncbi:MAG: PAS domain S-box protein [Bacteroidetes bacterium]|nr:PAS domain S-box protein [Bacteroidota bacterium]
MQRIRQLSSRSKLLLAGLSVLAVTITLFVWFEVSQSREELLHFVETEAEVLIETVNRSSITTVAANAELEQAIIDRLRLAAKLVESRKEPTGTAPLKNLAGEISVDLLLVFDGNGAVTAANIPLPRAADKAIPDTPFFTDVLQPVLRGEYAWLAQGGVNTPWSDQAMYVFVQERETHPGAVLLAISSSTMLEMRRRLGIGKLLRDIGTAAGIEFVVLQDNDGILTASEGIQDMSAIATDAFLRSAWASDSTCTRIVDYKNIPVFEVVKRLQLEEQGMALMRIGLSLEHVRSIQQRSMHRVVFIAIGFFITAAILLFLLHTRQRFGILQQEHRKVRSYTGLVLDNIADAVVATDALGVITVFNQTAARLFALEADAVLGRPCHEICRDDTLRLQHTRGNAVAIPYEETTLKRKDGDTRTLAVSTSVIHDDGGAVETIVAIARDITEQRRIQEQLQRKDRVTAMGELAGGIAHEIRNPLNAINIIAQRFQSEFIPAEDAEEYLQLTRTVRSEVQRVNTIITQFLDFARPARLALHPCEVHALLRESSEVISSQAAYKGIQLELLADEGLIVMADRAKMQQVLLNIFQNAIEALTEGGIIKTVACRRGTQIAITISDNGPGIPEETRKKIFNLYFTTKATGTGLGLSIVHQIVSEHGGDITVTSAEGAGSTFRILLPAISDTQEAV